MYRVAAYSTAGAVKESNQDSCFVEVAQTPYGDTALISVCDGVGGLSSGEVASSSVVHWFSEWFEERYPYLLAQCDGSPVTLFEWVQADWSAGFESLNDILRLYGRNTNQRMGSTCTAVLFYKDLYLIGHVGDCRAYQVFRQELCQLTEDQTWVTREVARGAITPEQARSHPRRNVILQSVGTQKEIAPTFVQGNYKGLGSTYMVCCDGFRNELFDDEILNAFSSSTPMTEGGLYDAMEELASLVMRRGERDNITAVCLCEDEGDDYGEPQISVFDCLPTIIDAEEGALPTEHLCEEDKDEAASEHEAMVSADELEVGEPKAGE